MRMPCLHKLGVDVPGLCDASRGNHFPPPLIRCPIDVDRYAASGSDSWDSTIDVHNRPQWLKDIVGIKDDAFECPAVDPEMLEVASLKRVFRPKAIGDPVTARSGAPPTNSSSGAIKSSASSSGSTKAKTSATKVAPVDDQAAPMNPDSSRKYAPTAENDESGNNDIEVVTTYSPKASSTPLVEDFDTFQNST